MPGHKLDNLKAQRSTTPLGDLAKRANVSDWTLRRLESGGNAGVNETTRIADALGVSLATLGKQDT
jgi:predicted transcriptional regulator